MSFHYFAGAAFRALTARKDGPSLYDVCDPLLPNSSGGDPHLGQFYKTALGNPALRPLLRRTGLPELRDEARLAALRAALMRARDDAEPGLGRGRRAGRRADGQHRGATSAARAAAAPARRPTWREIDSMIRTCAAHLLRSYGKNGFLPTYAAFNLIGDPDIGGREMLMALTGLNSRGYKNSTLLFNLARIFIAHSPARALINPPWTGIAEPMWEPVQIRHRSAYYDAFFTEALLSYVETGLASADETAAARRAIADMVDFCLNISREEVPAHDGTTVNVITALAPLPHPRFSRFFAQIKQDLGFGIYVPDCDTTACSFSAATQAGSTDPILDQPLLDFYRGYQVRAGANEPRVTVPLNDNIDYDGGVVTWIDNLAGERPYGNDLDPTLNLDILEVSLPQPGALEDSRDAVAAGDGPAHHRLPAQLAESGAFTNPRSHIYYLPELYCAYFGRCYAAFMALPLAAQRAIDPDGAFALHPRPRARLCRRRPDRPRDERVRRGAGADRAGHLGADVATLHAGAACASSPRSAKAAGTGPSRPMSGTR